MNEEKIVPERWREWWNLCNDGSTNGIHIARKSMRNLIDQLGAAEAERDAIREDIVRLKDEHDNKLMAMQRIAELESTSLLKPASSPVLVREKCICADSGLAKHFKIRSENNPACPIHGSIEEVWG